MKDLLFFIGLLIIGASADSCNMGNITIAQAVIQCLAGLIMMAFAVDDCGGVVDEQ